MQLITSYTLNKQRTNICFHLVVYKKTTEDTIKRILIITMRFY